VTTIPSAKPLTVAPRPALRTGVLLDRDGTIIVDHGYVGTIERVEVIPGAPEAIAALNAAGIPVVVVSNQSGVARGYFGLDDVERVHVHLAAVLAERHAHVDLFLYCPFHPDGIVPGFVQASEHRKPHPGMAHAAAEALDLDLASSWVVGDRPEDLGLAAAIGAFGVYLGDDPVEDPRIWRRPTLAAAVELILASLERTAP
jgi:D,D-heptose 1,7-bisphosphate phosphatase